MSQLIRTNMTFSPTGQLEAEFGYWENLPAMILKAKNPRGDNKAKRYIIRLNDAWIYSEDHYEQLNRKMPRTFEEFMLHKCLDLYELFDLGTPNSRQLAEVAWLIQDGIDQLMSMPPHLPRKKVVGEADVTITPLDGSDDVQQFTSEVTENEPVSEQL